jgi:threonine dehydrogenase-like Zn-dependent dehydrogenase
VQTGAGTVINGLRARPGSTMVVLGPGAVGLAAIMAAVVSGCTDIIAVGRTPASLDVARSLGATDVIDTTRELDLAKAIRARLPRGADYIVDAAGVSSLTEASMGGVANLGTLALVAVARPQAHDPVVGPDGHVRRLDPRLPRRQLEPGHLHPAARRPVPPGPLSVRQDGALLSVREDRGGHRRPSRG